MKTQILIFIGVLLVVAVLAVAVEPNELPQAVDTQAAAAGPAQRTPVPGQQPPLVGPPRQPSPMAPLSGLLGSDDARLVLGEGEQGTLNTHEFFASSPDRARLLRAAAHSALATLNCLRAGACEETPLEEGPDFDPKNARAQQLLGQSLRVMLEAANSGMEPDALVDDDELIGVIEFGSEESRLLALELLIRRASQGSRAGIQAEIFERILAQKERFTGESAHLFYSQLGDLTEQYPQLHGPLMRSLEHTWAHADAGTVLELIRHVEDLRLSEREYATSVQHLCRFTAPAFPKANWRALKHHLERYRSVQGFQSTPAALCRT